MGIEPRRRLKKRKLLILRLRKNDKTRESASLRYTAGTVQFAKSISLERKELHVSGTKQSSIVRQPPVFTRLCPKLLRCAPSVLPNIQCICSGVRQHKLTRWDLPIARGRIQH